MDSDVEDFHPHEILRSNLKRTATRKSSRVVVKKQVINKKSKTNTKKKVFTLFKCEVCNKEFDKKEYLKSHENVHKTECNYSCTQCAYRGKTVKYLSRHILKVHTAPTAHRCSYCNKGFHHLVRLKEHEMIHTGEKPHQCEVCFKSFRVPYSLKTHMLIHTNEKPYKCSFCSYACRDSSTLTKHQNNVHMKVRREYPCQLCGRRFKLKYLMKQHISEFHLDIDLRRFKCALCDKAFKKNDTLQFHKRAVHERQLKTKCPVCGARVSNRYNLQSHLRTHTALRPYACKHCNKTFKDKSAITKHSQTHAPRYACDTCGRRFSRQLRLVRHRATHLARHKSVQCDYCGDKFYTKNYLIKHIKQKHLAQQICICDMCGFESRNKPALIMHIKQHSTKNDRTCKICNKTLKLHAYLKQHYWVTHNIRYNIKKVAKRKIKNAKPSVEVKIEPVDTYEGIVDVNETTQEEEDDSTAYSKLVLSEDIESKLLVDNPNVTEVEFDDFVLHNMFKKAVKNEENLDAYEDIDQETLAESNRQVREMLKLAQEKREEEQRKKELIKKEKKLLRERRIKKKLRRKEIGELYRVIFMYNDRIRRMRQRSGKEQVKITYFNAKNKVDNSKTENVESNQNDSNKEREENKNDDFNNDRQHDEMKDLVNNNEINDDNETTAKDDDDDVNKDEFDDIGNKNDDLDEKDEIADLDEHNKNVCEETLVKDDESNSIDDESRNDDEKPDFVDENDDLGDEKPLNDKRNKKMSFKSYQCYICFKLYPTKEDLHKHCHIHFDLCNNTTLAKCPLCTHVSTANITKHILKTHGLDIKLPYNNIQTKTASKTGYAFTVDDKVIEIIPSVKILNHNACKKIERKTKEDRIMNISKTKLVKKGSEWVVEKTPMDVHFDVLPEFDKDDLKKLGVSSNNVERLKQLSRLAKKSGLKMGFPCFNCDKICQNFSGLKLHCRKHESNPKPFRKRRKNFTKTDTVQIDENETVKNKELRLKRRTEKSKPIVNRHKCDDSLKKFYENNIRGGDIEFWQFLKIFNRMERENVSEFQELESRSDFGIHFEVPDDIDDVKKELGIDNDFENSNVLNTKNITLATKNIQNAKNKIIKTKKSNPNARNMLAKSKNSMKNVQVQNKINKYTRVVMISKAEYMKRTAMISQLRDEIRQRNKIY